METKSSKAVFIVVVSVVCVVALVFAINFIKKSNSALSDEHKAVSDYYKELDLPSNAAGVFARSIVVHIDNIEDGHVIATTRKNNSDFFANRLVWIKFEGENLQERVSDLEAISSKIIGTDQTVAYYTVDKESTPHMIIAYDILSLDQEKETK